jgi:hypothetical protein
VSINTHRIRCPGDMRRAIHYPVHRPNWSTVAGIVLPGVVVAIVITVVQGRFLRQGAGPR